MWPAATGIAVEEALYLTGFAREVTLLCGRERLSAPKACGAGLCPAEAPYSPDTAVAEVGGSGAPF